MKTILEVIWHLDVGQIFPYWGKKTPMQICPSMLGSTKSTIQHAFARRDQLSNGPEMGLWNIGYHTVLL